MKISNHTSVLLITIILLGSTFTALGQPGNPTSPAPFGFLEVLIGAGAILGGKKAYDKRKHS